MIGHPNENPQCGNTGGFTIISIKENEYETV